MADIRPKDLPAISLVNPATGAFPIDDGVIVGKATAAEIVDAAAPLASQAEAETGTDNTKRITPLRVAQYVTAQLSGSSLPSAFGAKANATALGVAGSANNLGTFTGSIIPDNQTAKAAIQAVETAVEGKASKAGDTFTGDVTVSGSVARAITVDAPAGQIKQIRFRSDSLNRWVVTTTNSAESGGNSGANLYFKRYSDAGTFLGDSLILARDTGDAQFSLTPTVAGAPLALGDLSGTTHVNSALSQDTLTYPIGNELETYSQFNVFAADRRNDKREFIFNLCADFTHGPTSGTYEYEDHKAVIYPAANMRLACKKAWVLNPLITIKEDCLDPQFAVNTEFDLNNFNKHFGDADGIAGLPSPSAYNIMMSGSDALGFRVTAAAAIVGGPTNTLYNRGFMVGPNAVKQAAFDDYSGAASSYRDSGSHIIGINLQGTYSSSAITINGNAPAGVSVGGTKTVAGILEGSTTPIGLALNGTYANTPIAFATLPRNFANDAAAAAAVPPVPIGGVYRNGSALMVRAG